MKNNYYLVKCTAGGSRMTIDANEKRNISDVAPFSWYLSQNWVKLKQYVCTWAHVSWSVCVVSIETYALWRWSTHSSAILHAPTPQLHGNFPPNRGIFFSFLLCSRRLCWSKGWFEIPSDVCEMVVCREETHQLIWYVIAFQWTAHDKLKKHITRFLSPNLPGMNSARRSARCTHSSSSIQWFGIWIYNAMIHSFLSMT